MRSTKDEILLLFVVDEVGSRHRVSKNHNILLVVENDLQSLIDQAKTGDATSRALLLEACLPRIRAFVRLQTGPSVRAKESQSDIVQSTCAEILKALPTITYQDENSFTNWLYTKVLHKVQEKVKYYAREKRDPDRETRFTTSDERIAECYTTHLTPSRCSIAKEDLANFEYAFDQLPDHYRKVLMLSRIVGLPHTDIAEQLGRTEQAVRSILVRALARLTTAMDTRV